ncbi:MAG: preprotein translocase subunit SecY, preprotein translocase subunit SecY [Parcubacteria group bacterium]|nr:preprotein translocase subunit SecY, preprotein translocase subunit SecY [Parcubacteria group bacterium]
MISNFFRKLQLALSDPALRNRLLFLLGALVVFRFLAAIPISGIDRVRLAEFFSNNQFFGLLNLFSGGGFSHLSVVMLGVGPYITASIIMQLATVIFPQVKAMYTDEGEAGRAQFIMLSRLITIPLALLQGIAFLSLLQNQGILAPLTPFYTAVDVLLVAAGSILLMWIGELITEFGIGNGVSLIIFAGIVARVPSGISQALFTATAANIPAYVGFIAVALIAIFLVVMVSEAERSIPIAYARQVRGAANASGAATYLPIRLLQAGVVPIIFALSLILLPQKVINGLALIGVKGLAGASAWYTAFAANPWEYGAVYFVLVVMFTYLYTSITFEPHRVADNLQKSGAFVPGVRPGRETEKYIGAVVNRVTLPGALFLGAIAVVPFVVQGITGISAILVGGTALLIAVTVLLDLIRKVDAQVSLREY